MKSLFEESSFNEIINRLNLLNNDSKPTWGKMTVGPMAWHCQTPLQIAIENKDYKKAPNLLAKLFFKKALYSDKSLRKNLPAAPIIKAVEPKKFEDEIVSLKQLVAYFHVLKTRDKWNPHPLFGELHTSNGVKCNTNIWTIIYGSSEFNLLIPLLHQSLILHNYRYS